ncbi:cell wall hydrolase [Sphingomonas adhaesiva]|uniref:cell wall hydrolase n=1 Tax=Sphingomonas adhaesiva TaxID=28212 RepID=UPI002FF79330
MVGLIAQGSAALAADTNALPSTTPVTVAAATAVSVAAPTAAFPTATPAVMIQTPQLPADEAVSTPSEEEQVAYPTLAAAVADQSIPSNTGDDLRCLAGAIYFEARGEPLAGQLAVAEVILNRTQSRRFGSDVCSVVTQPGQFSFVRGGRIPAAPSNDDWRTAVAVAKVALKDAWESDASNALYFNGRRAGHPARIRVAAIGNHLFYR